MDQLGQPCWCGSGNAYAQCHRDKDAGSPPTLQDLIDHRRRAFSRKICLHPLAPKDCNQVIGAHTIQRGVNMEAISRDSKVYCVEMALPSLIANEGNIVPSLRGISQVSVINGFCSRHDGDFFQAIENHRFDWEHRQAFLYSYRAMARELYGKRAFRFALGGFRELNRGCGPIRAAMIDQQIGLCEYGADLAIRDLDRAKAELDELFISGAYERVRYYGVEFDSIFSVLCSAGLSLTSDFDGVPLCDLLDPGSEISPVYFNTFVVDDRGVAMFSWLPSADRIASQLVGSLDKIPDSQLADAILRLVFNQSDNLAISPAWWDQLSKSVQNTLMSRVRLGADLESARMDLVDDGLRIAECGVARRVWSHA